MTRRLRRAVAAWRRLGFRAGTARASEVVRARASGALRRRRLARRPLRVGAAELDAALGGRSPAAALRGALDALPSLATFERGLGDLTDEDRAAILRLADDALAHRFDLLGSGPTDLGERVDWQRDFKSGRSWPLDHISKMIYVYWDDDSDAAVPLKLSHLEHLPVLAIAYRLTGERRYLDGLGEQLDDWIEHNPVEFGINWLITLDVAIRAANLVAALALAAEDAEDEPWLRRGVESLLLHGRHIRRHLEWFEIRGNHYLSNVAGVVVLSTVFAESDEGREWLAWGARELVAEMEHQVRADGVDHEMTITYHRLVVEMFLWATAVVDALRPGSFPDWYRDRLDRMLDFVRDYTRPDGLAPQIGDGVDYRFLPLAGHATDDPRSHMRVFELAGRPYRTPEHSAAYREGGFYVMRAGDLYAIVRCGDAGLYGLGGHAHNDLLSFELALGDQPLVIDPGTFVYAADPQTRNLFRSTAFHSTLRVDGAEQNELSIDPLYRLPSATYGEELVWRDDGDRVVFEGLHHGFERLEPPAVHRRRLELDGAASTLTVVDTVTAATGFELDWSFPLAGGSVRAGDGWAEAEIGAARLRIEADGVEFAVEERWVSPSYGVRERTPFVRARRAADKGEDMTGFLLTCSKVTLMRGSAS
jgi:heparinase II/III-like protein